MPYDITDAKGDIETMFKELVTLEEELVKKGILDKPKEEKKEEGKK